MSTAFFQIHEFYDALMEFILDEVASEHAAGNSSTLALDPVGHETVVRAFIRECRLDLRLTLDDLALDDSEQEESEVEESEDAQPAMASLASSVMRNATSILRDADGHVCKYTLTSLLDPPSMRAVLGRLIELAP